LARVVLSCDLAALLNLATAVSSIGRSSRGFPAELGEAMPFTTAPQRWLSFARASLRWSDLLGGLKGGFTAGSAGGGGGGYNGRTRRRKESDLWVTSDQVPRHSATNFSTGLTSETSCAAMAEKGQLLATGHQDGIRLWGLPGGSKMGLLKTRSPVLSLDLGANFLFVSSPQDTRADGAADVVVAVMMSLQSPQSFMAAAWDLSSLGSTMPMPLWQIPVPSLVVHFLGPNVLLSSPVGAQLLCVSTGQTLESITLHSSQPSGYSCKCPLPSLWEYPPRKPVGRSSTTPSCVVLAVGRKVLAVVDADEKCSSSADVQRSAVFEFASEVAGDITALTGSSDVVAATSSSCIYVWSLVDRVLLAQLPAVSELDLENLSWSLCRAETLTGLQQTPWVSAILLLDELLVCCVNLGHPGSDSAACTWMAYHVPSCARLPHPWHLAGPLEASPSARAAATAPVLLPGISVGRLMADPSLRWVTVSYFAATSARQPVGCLLTRPPKPPEGRSR